MIILLALFLVIQPIDLPKVSFYWRDLPDSVRLEIGREFLKQGYSSLYIISTLALIGIEQPNKIPDQNACGLHAWKSKYHWGWGQYWNRSGVLPIGWFNAKESGTGKFIPYLAFNYFRDCFRFTLEVVINRSITNGAIYNHRWVGKTGYNRRFDKLKDYYLIRL